MNTWRKVAGTLASWTLLSYPLMADIPFEKITKSDFEAYGSYANPSAMISLSTKSMPAMAGEVITIPQTGEYLVKFVGISKAATNFSFQLKVNEEIFDLPVTVTDVYEGLQNISSTSLQQFNAGDEVRIETPLVFLDAAFSIIKQ